MNKYRSLLLSNSPQAKRILSCFFSFFFSLSFSLPLSPVIRLLSPFLFLFTLCGLELFKVPLRSCLPAHNLTYFVIYITFLKRFSNKFVREYMLWLPLFLLPVLRQLHNIFSEWTETETLFKGNPFLTKMLKWKITN